MLDVNGIIILMNDLNTPFRNGPAFRLFAADLTVVFFRIEVNITKEIYRVCYKFA